jgi:hypothetical protein
LAAECLVLFSLSGFCRTAIDTIASAARVTLANRPHRSISRENWPLPHASIGIVLADQNFAMPVEAMLAVQDRPRFAGIYGGTT